MTPDTMGYVKCEWCGCWRRPEDVHEVWTGGSSGDLPIFRVLCRDFWACRDVRMSRVLTPMRT